MTVVTAAAAVAMRDWANKINRAKRNLDLQRIEGDSLNVELACAALNDLLERSPFYPTNKTDKTK